MFRQEWQQTNRAWNARKIEQHTEWPHGQLKIEASTAISSTPPVRLARKLELDIEFSTSNCLYYLLVIHFIAN